MADQHSVAASSPVESTPPVSVDDDVLEYLRRLVLSDEQVVRSFRNLVSSDYNRILEKCLRLSRENHEHNTELQRLRLHNLALLEENQQLKDKTLVLLEGVRVATEENHRLVSENVHLARSPATRLLRKPGAASAQQHMSGSASARDLGAGTSGSSTHRPNTGRGTTPLSSARPSTGRLHSGIANVIVPKKETMR